MNNTDKKIIGNFLKIKEDFQEFAFSNKFVASGVGISVGIATKEYIVNVLNKIIYPLLSQIGKLILSPDFYKSLHHYHYILDPIREMLGDTIEWIIIIILTFVILEYFLNRKFLGLKTKLTEEEQIKLMKAKDSNKKHVRFNELKLEEKKIYENNENSNIIDNSVLFNYNNT
jgi:large-conductance mechanosensitive channel